MKFYFLNKLFDICQINYEIIQSSLLVSSYLEVLVELIKRS